MIPTEPDDGLAPLRGAFIALLICIAGWVVIVAIFAALYGCEASGGAQASTADDAATRLNALNAGIIEETNIRVQVAQKINDDLALGALVARYKPDLSFSDAYQIGKAVSYHSELNGLDPLLILSVIIVESHGDVRSKSPKGARGLMQVMPYWLDELGIDGDLYNIDMNVRVGTFILADNMRRWGRYEGLRRYVCGNKAGCGRYVKDVKTVLTGMKRRGNAA